MCSWRTIISGSLDEANNLRPFTLILMVNMNIAFCGFGNGRFVIFLATEGPPMGIFGEDSLYVLCFATREMPS